MRKLASWALVALAGLWITGEAAAVSLIGDEVNISGDLGAGFVNFGTFEVVEPAKEIENLHLVADLFFRLDIEADNIVIQLINTGFAPVQVGPGYITISDLDFDIPSELVGYTVIDSTFDVDGPTSFTADSITFTRTATGDLFGTGSWTIRYGLDTQPIAAPIPEPATMSLLSLGVLGLVARRKWRAR